MNVTGSRLISVLIPETCEYGTSCGKRDFAGVIKLRRSLEVEGSSWHAGGLDIMTRVLPRRRQEVRVKRKC